MIVAAKMSFFPMELGVWGLMDYSIFYQYLQGHGCKNLGNPFSGVFISSYIFPGGKFAQLKCRFHSGWEIEKNFQVSFFSKRLNRLRFNLTGFISRT